MTSSNVVIGSTCTWIPVPDDTMTYCPNNDQVVTGYCDSTTSTTSCMGGTVRAAMKCCSVPELTVDTSTNWVDGYVDSSAIGNCVNTPLGYYGFVNGICGASATGFCTGSNKHEVRAHFCKALHWLILEANHY